MSLKAFDLLPASEKVTIGDKAAAVIHCLECSGKNLYIGTVDSFIIRYVLEEQNQAEGRITVVSKKIHHKFLGFKKPISVLKAMSALNRLLCLCDGNFVLLNMLDLEFPSSQSKLKGVSTFCVNENPLKNNPFCVQVCVAKRKQLQLYNITEDKIIHVKDISVPETPLAVAMDGEFACIAMSSEYAVVDCSLGHVTDLFPYECDFTVPLVKRITKEEFLLNGPSSLGIFVTTAGISERPPLPWGATVVSAAYSHPYILCLTEDFLTVYSIFDQQPKQKLSFRGGTYLDNFEGKLFVSSRDMIYILIPVPWEKQVQALLADKKVAEALELAKHSNKTGLTSEQHKRIFQRIQQQAGFIEFSEFKFEEARDHFYLGDLDVRELIYLYPDLLSASSTFTKSLNSLHDIADVNQMCKNQPDMYKNCQEFLIEYLEESKAQPTVPNCKMEVDTALVKLYALFDDAKLLTLVNSSSCCCDVNDSIEYLEKSGKYHAMASLLHMHNDHEKALKVWSKILLGEYNDASFPELPFFVDILAKLSDHALVWKYADLALEKNEEIAVKIFINRPPEEPVSERMKPDSIMDSLHRYPVATVKYLEHLVFHQKLEKEKFHTHLAVLYLDKVLRYMKQDNVDPQELQSARDQLQHLLCNSSSYRVQLLLGKALENNLHQECAILYGKLEDHDKALRILVHQLEDYMAAEDYCQKLSQGKDRKFKHRLYHTLLGVYLDPALDSQKKEALLVPAVQLLNSEIAEFDAVKVLQLIPSDWSVAIVDQFLNKAVRSSLHRCYKSRIESSMARGENLQVKLGKIYLENSPIIMTEERLCSICRLPFTAPSFSWCPNGAVIHPQCSRNLSIGSKSDTKSHNR